MLEKHLKRLCEKTKCQVTSDMILSDLKKIPLRQALQDERCKALEKFKIIFVIFRGFVRYVENLVRGSKEHVRLIKYLKSKLGEKYEDVYTSQLCERELEKSICSRNGQTSYGVSYDTYTKSRIPLQNYDECRDLGWRMKNNEAAAEALASVAPAFSAKFFNVVQPWTINTDISREVRKTFRDLATTTENSLYTKEDIEALLGKKTVESDNVMTEEKKAKLYGEIMKKENRKFVKTVNGDFLVFLATGIQVCFKLALELKKHGIEINSLYIKKEEC